MPDVDEITLRGEKPVKAAVSWLKGHEGDGDIGAVTIKFEAGETTSESGSGRYKTEFRTHKTEKAGGKHREKGDIRAETSHHAVAYALANVGGKEEYIPGPVVEDEVESLFLDVSESSIYPALTNLWERKLADRERKEGVYHYKLTDFGKERVEELGKPGKGNNQ